MDFGILISVILVIRSFGLGIAKGMANHVLNVKGEFGISQKPRFMMTENIIKAFLRSLIYDK